MHHLRDVLLSPSPKGHPETTTANFTLSDLEDLHRPIPPEEISQVRDVAFGNRTWAISNRFCSIGDGVDALEGYIHSIWQMYFQLGRSIPCDSAEHEAVILDILRIQGLGPLSRPARGNYGIDMARTTDGTLWNDLPFLASDMTELWINHVAWMSSAHRLNLATFLAKLASTRVCKDRICRVALVLFRLAFEMPQELRSETEEECNKEDSNRTLRQLEIIQLLPCVIAWLREAGHNLLLLSEVYWNDCPSNISKGGEEFLGSELGERSPAGFSPWRYIFWIKRLHEIRDLAKERSEKGLEQLANDGIEYMVVAVRTRSAEVIRVFEKGGDVLRKDKHLLALRRLVEDLESEAEDDEAHDDDDGELDEDE